MSLPWILVPQAQAEADDSFDHYERQQPGLGVDFFAAVRDTLQTISVTPQMFAVVHRDIREAPVRKFPFCIYYRVKPSSIRVVSVFHTSRDPQVWQGRR